VSDILPPHHCTKCNTPLSLSKMSKCPVLDRLVSQRGLYITDEDITEMAQRNATMTLLLGHISPAITVGGILTVT